MIIVIETSNPDGLSIVTSGTGVVQSSALHASAYAAAVALLCRCQPDELRMLELNDLRNIKRTVAEKAIHEAPVSDRETSAAGSLEPVGGPQGVR